MIITPGGGERSVVMLSLEDYKALEETAYRLRDPTNARLLSSVSQLAAGKGSVRELAVRLVFSDDAWKDYPYWQKLDRKMVERIDKLTREVMREPFADAGKPEPLKHALWGF